MTKHVKMFHTPDGVYSGGKLSGHIPVEMFYTPDGERTCALDIPGGEFCPYFRTQKFGTEDTCLFAPEDYHGRCQTLERRGEVGYTIVGDWCPITEVV